MDAPYPTTTAFMPDTLRNTLNRATNAMNNGAPSKAGRLLEECLILLDEHNTKHWSGGALTEGVVHRAYCYSLLGSLATKRGDIREAIQHHQQAYDILQYRSGSAPVELTTYNDRNWLRALALSRDVATDAQRRVIYDRLAPKLRKQGEGLRTAWMLTNLGTLGAWLTKSVA